MWQCRSRCGIPWWKPWSACCSWGLISSTWSPARGSGAGSAVSTGGGRLPRRVPGAAGRGDVHRLRLVGDPRTDHGHRHGRRDRAGHALARVRPGAGWTAVDSLFRASGSACVGLLVGPGLTQVVRKTAGVRLPPRGDGLRRRRSDGDDRRLHGLAGGRPDFFPRLRSSAWAMRLEVVQDISRNGSPAAN